MAAASHPSTTHLATRRLLQEQQELLRHPIEGVAVQVAEQDVFTVHANMVPQDGPYAGSTVHMHLVFPPSYPDQPPAVHLKTVLDGHPNVFPDWGHVNDGNFFICLDMLKQNASGPYRGWSPAYTLSNVLRQLYGFLLVDDNLDQHYGSISRRHFAPPVVSHASVACQCGFTALPPPPQQLPQPPIAPSPRPPGPVAASNAEVTAAPPRPPADAPMTEASGAEEEVPALPADILSMVLARADATTVALCAQIQGELGHRAQEALRREEERCFYTHEPLASSTSSTSLRAVLGYGVSVVHHRDGEVKALSMRMDLLSYSAFRQYGVRRSAWNEPFDTFLPLPLNADHSVRALDAFDEVLPELRGGGPSQGREADILSVLAKLMNSLVIEICSTEQQQQQHPMQGHMPQPSLSRHMSDAALQGFCHLHHLLLALAERAPGLLAVAGRDVAAFMDTPAGRHKRRCPDLGMLLIKLLLVPMDAAPWERFGPVFLRELLARQVRFVQQKSARGAAFAFPQRDDCDFERCEEQFVHSTTSLMLVCIEVWFANALARPAASASAVQELAAIRTAYDSQNGRPPERVFERFNEYARGVRRIGSWTDVLARLHMSVRTAEPATVEAARRTFANVLRQAAVDSNEAGYSMHDSYRGGAGSPCWEAWAPDALPVVVVTTHPW